MEYYITKCENCGDISLRKHEFIPSKNTIVENTKDISKCDEKYCVFNDGMQRCHYGGINPRNDDEKCLKIKLL